MGLRSRPWILGAIVLGAFGSSYALKTSVSGRGEGGTLSPASVRRIASLAPSTTETLFALGLGDRIVGVCEYCKYPPEALTKPKLGGYYTPNYEALLEARPDLVVILPEHDAIRERILDLGVEVLDVDHRSVKGILDSITVIGEACGVPEQAASLLADLEGRVEKVKSRMQGRPRPRVLVSIGRAMNEGGARRITTCGRGGYYDDLIEMAGGVNAYEGTIPFPALSPEGVLALDPDVIVEMMPDLVEKGGSRQSILRDWATLPGLEHLRVRLIAKPYAVVPGPRFILLLEDLAEAIHPEAPGE